MSRQPNVIVILSDDQGYGDLSCHGNPILQTPCLDRLHDESVRFTDFHVAPMCTPTRAQLLTGRDSLPAKATHVAFGRASMCAGMPTIANYLRDNDYCTDVFFGEAANWITRCQTAEKPFFATCGI